MAPAGPGGFVARDLPLEGLAGGALGQGVGEPELARVLAGGDPGADLRRCTAQDSGTPAMAIRSITRRAG
jgi:hypothetical protein